MSPHGLDAEFTAQRPHARAQQRRLDEAASARPVALDQGGEDAGHGGQCRECVAQSLHQRSRCGTPRGHLVGDASSPEERGEVVPCTLLVRPSPAVGCHGAVDEPRVPGLHHRRREGESLQGTGTQVGQEHIGPLQQPVENLPAGLGFHLDLNRTLPAVRREEGTIGSIRVKAERAEQPAHRVASRRLDFDDLCPPVSEHSPGCRASHPVCEFDNPYPAQRIWDGHAVFCRLLTCGLELYVTHLLTSNTTPSGPRTCPPLHWMFSRSSREKSGIPRNHSSSPTRNSRVARPAPRHRCPPEPNVRWRFGLRSSFTTLGSTNCFGSLLAAARGRMMRSPASMDRLCSSTPSLAMRATVTGAYARSSSSTALPSSSGSAVSRARSSGCVARCQRLAPMTLHVVSAPASRISKQLPS